MARISRAAAAVSPRCSSSITPDQNVPIGLAMPLPMMSKAEPWIGSNMEGNLRSGLRLAVGAMPSEPASAAARSDRMSACRLVATTVSIVCGLSIMRMVMASTSILSQVTSGNSRGHLGGDLVPHHHAVALGVRLGDDGQQLARPRAGEREGKAHDARDAGAREHRHVGGRLLGQAAMHAAADARVLAFRVLAHDHPVELGPGDGPQRAGDARQDARRAARWRTGRRAGRWRAAAPTA